MFCRERSILLKSGEDRWALMLFLSHLEPGFALKSVLLYAVKSSLPLLNFDNDETIFGSISFNV